MDASQTGGNRVFINSPEFQKIRMRDIEKKNKIGSEVMGQSIGYMKTLLLKFH